MHPSSNVIKVYEVKVFGMVLEEHLKALREGYPLKGKRVRPLSVRVIKRPGSKTWLEFRHRRGQKSGNSQNLRVGGNDRGQAQEGQPGGTPYRWNRSRKARIFDQKTNTPGAGRGRSTFRLKKLFCSKREREGRAMAP